MTPEQLLDTGLRNLWYPVLPAWRLRETPLGITRLGEKLVLWRDAAGGIQALEDRCPHRGARLSLSWDLGERVACWCHGVAVRGDGVLAALPVIDSRPLVGQFA